jgi:Phage integrase, N-terminal SAM-like domain
MTRQRREKRAYGSGSIVREGGSWYGKWRVEERQVKRRLGPVRPVGTSEGLTRKQAEAELRRLMGEVKLLVPEQRVTFEQAAERYVQHVEHVLRRKPSTVQDYRIMVRRHLAPHFESKAIERIKPADVESYIAVKFGEGLAVKTITNQLNFAHGVFQFALRRGWATSNPVALTDRPRSAPTDPDIRFLTAEEFEALLRAVALEETLGPTDHALYMAAAMTGLRQGSSSHCVGATSTGRQGSCACGVTTAAAPGGRRSRGDRVARCRLPTGLRQSSSAISSARPIGQTRIWCSAIRRRATPTMPPSCENASTERWLLQECSIAAGARAGSPSTRSDTRSARVWPRWACRCARFRSGWAIEISRQR